MMNRNLKMGLGSILLGITLTALTACSQKDADIINKHANNAVDELASENNTQTTNQTTKDNNNESKDNKQTNIKQKDTKQTDSKQKDNKQTNTTKTDKPYTKAYLDTIESVKKEHPDEADSFKYDLIYFNNDDIPDLVIQGKHTTSIYYYDGKKVLDCVLSEESKLFYQEKNGVEYLNYIYNYADYKFLVESFSVCNNKNNAYLLKIKKLDNNIIPENLKNKQQISFKDSSLPIHIMNSAINYGTYFGIDGDETSEEKYINKIKELSICTDEQAYLLAEGTKSFEQIKRELQK